MSNPDDIVKYGMTEDVLVADIGNHLEAAGGDVRKAAVASLREILDNIRESANNVATCEVCDHHNKYGAAYLNQLANRIEWIVATVLED